jgi:hypothetical protein
MECSLTINLRLDEGYLNSSFDKYKKTCLVQEKKEEVGSKSSKMIDNPFLRQVSKSKDSKSIEPINKPPLKKMEVLEKSK